MIKQDRCSKRRVFFFFILLECTVSIGFMLPGATRLVLTDFPCRQPLPSQWVGELAMGVIVTQWQSLIYRMIAQRRNSKDQQLCSVT